MGCGSSGRALDELETERWDGPGLKTTVYGEGKHIDQAGRVCVRAEVTSGGPEALSASQPAAVRVLRLPEAQRL
jgi:hypothetical protein